ncbi:MAG: efflux RND transporter periplasmic adaptor subunit [Gammaproteobacteria bacterium]
MPKTVIVAGERDIPAENSIRTAYPAVFLDQEAQRITGIQTVESQRVEYQSEFIAFGRAVDIAPLLAQRHQYLRALTDSKSAAARFTRSDQRIKQIRNLYSHGVAAKRSLQEQQSQWQTDKAQVEGSHFQIQAVLEDARLNWGKQLTEWAMTADSEKMEPFLSRQNQLLLITLPSDRLLSKDIKTVFVAPSGNRDDAQPAGLISEAPKTDNTIQGNSYFFQTQGRSIRTGMNVTVWIPENTNVSPGVIVPKAAIVWSMDQSFVYIKTGNDSFMRRMVRTNVPVAEGYFVSGAIEPGELIVTTGGQMLWSEELREHIPGGDD